MIEYRKIRACHWDAAMHQINRHERLMTRILKACFGNVANPAPVKHAIDEASQAIEEARSIIYNNTLYITEEELHDDK